MLIVGPHQSLESVTSSQSVWSALECQLRLRKAGIFEVLLVILWCLSPLGSQASLRLLRQSELSDSTVVPIRYRSTGPAASIFAFEVSSKGAPFLEAVLSTSAHTMARLEDLVGDIKIPRFELLNSTLSTDGWKTVPPVLEREHFSSMLGLRVVGIPLDRETRFSLESSYASAECGAFVKLPYSLNLTLTDVERLTNLSKFNFTATARAGLMPGSSKQGEFPQDLRKIVLDADGTIDPNRLKAFLGVGPSQATLTNKTTAAFRQLVIASLYAQEIGRRHDINIATCRISEMRVESAIFCPNRADGDECRVERMRLSRIDTRPSYLTHFDSPVFARNIASYLSEASSSPDGLASSIERFLYRGQSSARVSWHPSYKHTKSVDLSRIPPHVLSSRLSILINTYIQVLLSANDDTASTPDMLFRNATAPVSDLDLFVHRPQSAALSTDDAFQRFYSAALERILVDVVPGLPFIPAATTATATKRWPVFVCNFAWLSVLLLASATLFATGAASLALQLRAVLAPDMLRYAASMTFANPYFRVQTPTRGGDAGGDSSSGGHGGGSLGTALDGMERAKLLRRVRVRIADVNGSGDVGAVAFVAADDIETRELERHRLYA